MTIHELCRRFNLKPSTIHKYAERGIIPPALATGRNCSPYTIKHVEAIEAYLALKSNNIFANQAVAFCEEAGITLRQYMLLREQSIRDHGLGIA